SKGWTNERTIGRSAFRRCRTRDPASAGKGLARAHATTPDRGVAYEERLQASRGPPLQSARRLGRRVGLRGPRRRAEQNAVLHLEFCARRRGLQSQKRGDFYAHSNAHGHSPAHGAVGLPDGSEAGLRGRQGGVAAVLFEARAALGADRLKSTGLQTSPPRAAPAPLRGSL